MLFGFRNSDVRKNKNKADSIETGRIAIPYSLVEHTFLVNDDKILSSLLNLICKCKFTCSLFWTKDKLTNHKKII